MEDAIHELTNIAVNQKNEISELRNRIKWLERNTKRRRLSMFEAIGYSFSDTLGAAMGRE